jgi:hypothetical protein
VQVVITSGHPHSGYRLVHDALERGGLEPAHPSRLQALTPEALIQRVLHAHEIDLGASLELEQLVPGKVWQELAVDLFVENLSKQNWGWADAGATWLLDFWLRFDEQTRFVLVYSNPAVTMTRMMQEADTTVDSLGAALESWSAWNSELLQFAARHPQRCLLVNTVAVQRSPAAVVASANQCFDMSLMEPSGPASSDAGVLAAVPSFLMNAILLEFSDAFALYDELESAAQLQDGHDIHRAVTARDAWQEHRASLSQLAALRADLHQETDRHRHAELERHSAVSAHEESRKQLQSLRGRLESAQQAAAAAENQEAQLLLRNATLAQENELLFLQMRQLQEALEGAASAGRESERQCRELAAKVTTAAIPKGSTVQLAEVTLDMRREIDGKNWYWAEHDGRWAGPGTHGTLRLPAMGPGRYEVNLEVVDAMAPEILAAMQVTLCGMPLSLVRDGKAYPANLKGVVSVENIAADRDWDMSFRFPSLSSPAERGSTDRRQLAIRLRSVRLRYLADVRESLKLAS